ncbi:hypothetical protein CRUP_022430 [Coryphaenoides rupestris]|nr:hypothetical protein CRUP_022430 [Coryphaenoides rupestris]
MLREEVKFGSQLEVHVHSRATGVYNLTVLSLEEVCYLNLDATVKDCHAPRLEVVANHERDEVVLRLDIADAGGDETAMYQKFWNEMPGEALEWPKGQREVTMSTNAVAPCLCFQVWWKGKPLRRKSCPFKNLQGIVERMQSNVSVSLSEAPVWGHRGNGRQPTALHWNVSAPCRLDGDVWLCRRGSAGGGCSEVTGSRQRLHYHTHPGWRATANGHWVKLHGSHSNPEPHCPFAGVVAGNHVVLLHHSDGGGEEEQALPLLLSRLGASLQSLGFSVTLDLWSQMELAMLGPVPWLHAQLDRIQRKGGKVVLVLSRAAWSRADEWGGQGWDRGGAKGKGEEEMEEDGKGSAVTVSSKHVDAFSASLSCVLADYMQGRAGERFVLVQFESLPPQAPGSNRPLPELFRGLYLHCLPSQSLAFLTDLAGARHGTGAASAASASARRKKAGKLRVASRVLARGLTGAGVTMLRLAGLPQDCVGEAEEDTWETVPLHPCTTTTTASPPSSPDTSPKEAGMEWV